MRAEQLFEGIPVKGRLPEGQIGAIRSDSRRAVPGCLFVCLKGAKRDGHDCAAEAVEKGAAAVLGEHPAPGVKEENMLLTPDTRAAESMLWNNLTGRPADGMMKIAVTGTAGKTTVTLLLSELLRASGRKTGYVTTVGAAAGDTPLSLGENGGSSVSDIPGAMTTPDPELPSVTLTHGRRMFGYDVETSTLTTALSGSLPASGSSSEACEENAVVQRTRTAEKMANFTCFMGSTPADGISIPGFRLLTSDFRPQTSG